MLAPSPVDPLRLIADERGVFLRSEALDHCFDDKALARAVRDDVLVRVRHGSYAFADQCRALRPEARHLLLGRAAMRRLRDVALSHVTAAIAHGMDVWDVDLDRAHVTRVGPGAGRTEPDLVHHEGTVTDAALTTTYGVPATSPVRAALETAALVGTERGLVTVSSGLHLGLFDQEDLAAQHEVMMRWPGAQPLHLVTRLADHTHESAGEVRTAYLFWRAGLPRPVAQYDVHDVYGRFIGRVDFAWPQHRLIVEFDGRSKYQQHLREGESATDVVLREKAREDRLREAGWVVVRLVWSDLARPAEVARRVRRHLV